MGWLYMYSLEGHATPKAYLDAAFSWSNEDGENRVLKSVVKGRVYYAAVERLRSGHERMVFAAVALFRYGQKARDGLIFGYKDMDETVGPHERDCPASILDLLTPTKYEYAIQWRADCRGNLKTRAAVQKRRPKEGDTVILAEPMTFTNGARLSRFRAVRLPRRRNLVFLSLEQGGYYRLSSLASREHRIESAQKEEGRAS